MKKILIFSFILGFGIINFFSFQDFYWNAVGNYFFSQRNFSSANSYYLKSNSKESIFNTANTLYKEKKYIESNEKYLSILTPEKHEFYFKLNHNIGNNYYKLSLNDTQKEKEYLEQSVTYYTNALDIRYDEETKKNLEFVMEKLKKIKEKQEKENEQKEDKKEEQNSDQTGSGTQSNQNTGTGSSSENSQNGSGTTNENTGSGNTQTQTGSISKEENKTGTGSEKSQSGSTASSSNKPEEKGNSPEIEKQLKAYEEQLKEEQKQNQSEVGKVYQPQNSQDPFSQFDNFFNTPSFDNSLLNDADNKKDW